jgi:hypothetical protein
MNAPFFGYWLGIGLIVLIVITLGLTALWYLDQWMAAHRSDEAVRRNEADLEAERRRRALDVVNKVLPMSQRVKQRG